MMTASDRAVEKLKDELIKKFLDVGLGYRITGKTCEPGCITLTMELDKEQPSDEVVVSHGIKILIDHQDAALLIDYELDYIDGPNGSFCLKNEKKTNHGHQG